MLRQHQFEKVEMVSVTRPEDSLAELDRMTRCAEDLLERLGLPWRTMVLSTGDMGFAARKTHDVEVWLPGQGVYREISSCSVCGDFQARRMNARFRREGEKRPEFVHTLNGSGLAVGRALIAVIENGQEADGSVTLPGALAPYLGGARRIGPDGALA
jgi:seryl-tRNA synthetase